MRLSLLFLLMMIEQGTSKGGEAHVTDRHQLVVVDRKRSSANDHDHDFKTQVT